jgi:hypothetical protein
MGKRHLRALVQAPDDCVGLLSSPASDEPSPVGARARVSRIALMNSGVVVHGPEEIARVRGLLAKEPTPEK